MNDYYVGQRVRLTGWQWGDEHGDNEDWIGTLATVTRVERPERVRSDRDGDGFEYNVVEGWEVEPV